MSKELKNKTAIICGGTEGIGFAIAKLFASNGCNLVIISHNEENLKKTSISLENAFKTKVDYLIADLNNTDALRIVLDDFFSESKILINILVNNVRGPMPAILYKSNIEILKEVFERHVISNQIITSKVVEKLVSKKKPGRIINICDNTSIAPYPSLGLSSIRAAEISWALSLSLELASFGITVNNILPGPTDTTGLKQIINIIAENQNISYEEKRNEILDSLPLKRFARPEEIANVALFLASEKSSYITGSNIKVDGGFNINL